MTKKYEFKNKAEQDLSFYLRANYPIIYVSTHEEERVKKFLDAWCTTEGNKQLWTWDACVGLRTNSTAIDTENTDDPTIAVEAIINMVESGKKGDKKAEERVFIMNDLFRFLHDDALSVQFERTLKNAAGTLGANKIHIVIVSPEIHIPLTLEKIIPVVDYPLPDAKILKEEAFDVVIKSVTKNPVNKKKIEPNLPQSDEEWETVINAAKGLTVEECKSVIAKSIVEHKKLDIPTILQEKIQIVRRSGLLEFIDTKDMSINDVGGLDALKGWLSVRKDAGSKEAQDYGLRSPKGVVLLGVQGCGKSHVAKTTAALWKIPCLRMDMGKLFGGIVGESESNVRNAMKVAESVAPAVLWIDEIEKGMSGTRSSGITDGGTTARVLSSFLTWMQEKKEPVFVIATANDLGSLPPEIVRKGRFDEIFFVDLPNEEERNDIFSIHIKKNNRDPQDYDLNILTTKSDGFSGAEIEESIGSAMYIAFADGKREFNTQDIVSALENTNPLSITMSEEIEQFRNEWAGTRARYATTPIKTAKGKKKKPSVLDGKGKKNKTPVEDEDEDGVGDLDLG